MKTKIQIISFCAFVIALVLMAVGCSTPEQKKSDAEKKIAVKVEQVKTNQLAQTRQAVAMVEAGRHAVERSMQDLPKDSPFYPYAKVTLDVLDTGLAGFQAADVMPDSAMLLTYRRMVDNLLSTNAQLRVEGSNTLAAAQSKLAASERKADSLEADKSVLQAKLDEVNAENAVMATTWSKITHAFWWIVWIIVGIIVFRIIGALVPPPYDNFFFIIDHLAGLAWKWVMKFLPQAGKTAGVVTQSAFDSVIKGVGNARAELQAMATHADDKTVAPSAALSIVDTNLTAATAAITPIIDASRATQNV